jgi:hypothetical protein
MAKSASKSKKPTKSAKPAAKAASAAPKTAIVPWIRIEDYKTLRDLTASDMKLPETFMEWVQIQNQKFAKLQSDGVNTERSMVRPDAFDAWCKAKGAKRNEASFNAFAQEIAAK